MTRVQELGRLCRYPGVSQTEPDTVTLTAVSASRDGDVQAQIDQAFSFACGGEVKLELQKCEQIALSVCEAAKDIFAYVKWMSLPRQRWDPQHCDKVRQLVEALATQVIMSLSQ